LVLAGDVDPTHYGELVRFGKAVPWHDGAPLVEQDLLIRP
jgi:hypothetical protein